MVGLFTTPHGSCFVTNGRAQGLSRAWLALACEPGSPAAADGRLVAFLEERVALAQSPGLGGFDVTEPPLDLPPRRRRFAALNAELARRMFASDFDGALLDVRWADLDEYLRCRWLEPVEAIHLGLHASLGEPAPALGWDLTAERQAAIDALRAGQRLVSAPRPGRSEELAILRHLTENVVAARTIFARPWWRAVEHHFFRRAELEEAAGRLESAAATWRMVASVASDPGEKALAQEIAAELEARASARGP